MGVADFSPLFLTCARAIIAAALGALFLYYHRQPLPKRADYTSLLLVTLGAVVGFPLLSAYALQHMTSAHSIVFIGLLPLSTSIFGVLRGGERPQPVFWVFALIGATAVIGFALHDSTESSLTGDLLMLASIIVCGLGYAEGAALSRRLGGCQVISWALVLSLPLMFILACVHKPTEWASIHLSSWISLAYISLFSMFIGFVFWYRGLALGGIAKVGQLQLLQPFFALLLASFFLHEPITWMMIASTLAVILCVAGAKRFA